MPMTPEQIEEAKLVLERERVEIEKSKAVSDNRFLNRKFPALATGLISLAAVFVSLSQVYVAWIQKEKEMEINTRQNRQQLEINRQQNEHQENLSMAKFVVENAKVIFEGNKDEQTRIRNVILATFPEKIGNALFKKLQETASSPEAVSTWYVGQKATSEAAASSGSTEDNQRRVFLHYQDPADASLMDSLMGKMRENGFRVPGRQLVTQATKGDVRFYHSEDETAAKDVGKMVEEFLASKQRQQKITPIPLGAKYPDIPKGVIEVWVPRKS